MVYNVEMYGKVLAEKAHEVPCAIWAPRRARLYLDGLGAREPLM